MNRSRGPAKGDLIGKVVSVLAFVGAVVAVSLLLRTCRRDPGPVAGTAASSLANGRASGQSGERGRAQAARFDREIESSAAPAAQVFKVLKRGFPEEYADYLRIYAERSGAGIPAAAFTPETQTWLAKFVLRHTADLVRAPDAFLLAAIHSQTAVALALRASSPALCAKYATTGLRAGDAPPPSALTALYVANAAEVSAMAEGRRRPVRTVPVTMSPEDAEAFAAATVRQGATRADLQAMSSPSSAAALPPQRQCDLYIWMLQGIAALPSPQGGRVAAVILQDTSRLR